MNINKVKVDFLGIGVEKAGTTWLQKCLREHPEICFPKNTELYFFNDVDSHFLHKRSTKYPRGINWYLKQFRNCPVDSIKGEWSTTYFYTKETAKRIKEHLPDVKMIVSLRNPVERTFSQYLYETRLGFVEKNESFEEVLKRRPDYIEKGYYAKHLKNYYSLFHKKQIYVLIFENFKKEPKRYIKDIFKFLGVSNSVFIPPSLKRKVNPGGTALIPELNRLMINSEYLMRDHGLDPFLQLLEITGIRNIAMKIRDINNKKYASYPKMKEKTRKYLYSLFKKDIEKLEKTLKADLSIWKL